MNAYRRRLINLWARARSRLQHRGVSTRVSPLDDMLDHGTLHIYFDIGASAMGEIEVGLNAAGAPPPSSVLDLPSGFGRVMRHMRAKWPRAQLSAMDLQHEGPRFCASEFGATPVFSAEPLWSVDAGDGYDLLWSGSLLTHFDAAHWQPTITYFRDRLRPGGTLIFTTHGDLTIRLIAGEADAVAALRPLIGDYGLGAQAAPLAGQARTSGFAYWQYPNVDLSYGISFSTPEWVRRAVDAVGGLEFVRMSPAGWFGHQDVWTYRRSG